MATYHGPTTGGGLVQSMLTDDNILADDGQVYATISEAITAASDNGGWIWLPPRRFDADVLIEKDGLSVFGMGRGTRIVGDTTSAIRVNANDVEVIGLSVETEPGNGTSALWWQSGAERGLTERIWVLDSDNNGIFVADQDVTIRHVVVENCSTNAVQGAVGANRLSVMDLRTLGNVVDEDGVRSRGDESRIEDCTINGTGSENIRSDGDDTVITGNVCINAGADGIRLEGTNQVATSNRIMETTDTALRTGEATTPTTGNNNTN